MSSSNIMTLLKPSGAEWHHCSLPRRGGPPQPRRPVLNGIVRVLATGASWRDLPPRYPPWPTCYYYFAR